MKKIDISDADFVTLKGRQFSLDVIETALLGMALDLISEYKCANCGEPADFDDDWTGCDRCGCGTAEKVRPGDWYGGVTSVPADTTPVIDLDREFMEEMRQAARESEWMPPDYCANDWQSDVLEFLRKGSSLFVKGWEESAEFLLESTDGAVRVRPGGGEENLMESLIVTYVKLREADKKWGKLTAEVKDLQLKSMGTPTYYACQNMVVMYGKPWDGKLFEKIKEP